MSGPGRSRDDVRAWPRGPEARAALENYLDGLPADPAVISKELTGDLLDFRGADLSRLELAGAFLFNADLAGVCLAGASLGRANLGGAMLRDADLTGADLTKAEAPECDAQNAIFKESSLFAIDLSRADLRSADLRGAVLNSASLTRADLGACDLRGASLRFCRFGRTERSVTSLSWARLNGCAVDEASGFVKGPADVGDGRPHLLDGADLESWFHAHGANEVKILPADE